MTTKFGRTVIGSIAAIAGVITVWLALRGANVPLAGLGAASIGVAAAFAPELVVLLVVPLAVSGASWAIVRLAVLAMVAALATAMIMSPRSSWIRPRWAHAWIAGLALLLVISAVAPAVIHADAARYDLVTLIAGLTVLAACAAMRLSEKALCAAVSISGAAAAVMVLVAGDRADDRLVGLTLNPNYLGALLALPVVASFALAVQRRQVLWLLPGAVCAVALVATESRGATVAALVGLAYVVVAGRRWWLQVGGLVAAAAIALAMSQALYVGEKDPLPTAAPSPVATTPVPSPAPRQSAKPNPKSTPKTRPGVSQKASPRPSAQPTPRVQSVTTVIVDGSRTSAELTYNNSVRARAALLAADVALHHPLRGIGYAGFAAYAQTADGFGIYMNTHNDYLRLAAEAGMPALIAFGVLVAMGLRRRGGRQYMMARALVVTNLVTLLFANTLSNLAVSIAFWAALGILLANPPLRPEPVVAGVDEPAELAERECAITGC
ncbi:hypothetical protein F4553_004189 [Allocatelliglobosispora scoriae]|uniref:O-antigen ligase-related domain-containing protein n=1 Tax=Allocatelliglobosispora scoriae TaxID=643052 RepID=A0A841BVM0_9ACTN|nr:hypothetical protein [Allocatelliglobosispora scoriae]